MALSVWLYGPYEELCGPYEGWSFSGCWQRGYTVRRKNCTVRMEVGFSAAGRFGGREMERNGRSAKQKENGKEKENRRRGERETYLDGRSEMKAVAAE